MSQYDPAPGSLEGKQILITGGNTGLGRESAIRLARAGATVVITARTDAKGEEARDAIRRASGSGSVYYLKLDLADLASVRSFVEAYKQQPYGSRVDVVMNNAGVMAIPERRETKDGFEQQFGVNHLGHFALVGLLLPLLRNSKGMARVINVSSIGHFGATKELMEDAISAPEKYTQWGAYSQSKLANVLFAKELDRRFKANSVNAVAVSCHPGGVDTDLTRWVYAGNDSAAEGKQRREENTVADALYHYLSRSVELGANTQVYLAAKSGGDVDGAGGAYFDNMAQASVNPAADDEGLARKLWEASERLTGIKFGL